jgi:hypothetical protein
MPAIDDALELFTAQHEQIEDLYEQVRQIGDEAAFVELADKLATHLALEAELFYPAIGRHLSPAVMSERADEHAAIKQVVAELPWLASPRDPAFRRTLARLGELLAGHTAWQEDELFPAAASALSPSELAALCERFYAFDKGAVAA